MQPDSSIIQRVRLPMGIVNVVAVVLVLGCIGGTLGLIRTLPHFHVQDEFTALWALPTMVVFFVVHKWVHGYVCVRNGGAGWGDIRFGTNPKLLIFYCHCRVPVRLSVYRKVVVAPLFWVGGTSYLFLLAFPMDWLAFASAIHLAGCIGDVWMLIRLRRIPAECMVQDHPTEPGCDILTATRPTGPMAGDIE